MSIESELFANVEIQRDKLADYGFQPEGDLLIYRKPLPEDRFEIVKQFGYRDFKERLS